MIDTPAWVSTAIRALRDNHQCPVCEANRLVDGCCHACGADLRGATGTALWNASQDAVAALEGRQQLVSRVPRTALAMATADATPTVAAKVATAPTPSPTPADEVPVRSSATLQSVLAVAGAGLFAIAAIVFTFFNPDLTDKALRSVIVALITVVFLGGAWLLARRSLQFSAEAVGALGLVFVGLDVWALAQLAPADVSPWLPTAGLTLAAAVAMVAASRFAGVRIWLWAPVVALTLVPTMVGEAAGHLSAAVLGRIGTSFAAAALIALLPRIGARFDSQTATKMSFHGERVTLLIVQLVSSGVALLMTPLVVMSTIDSTPSPTADLLASALLLGLLAAHALVATRQQLPRFWSLAAGGMGTVALALVLYSPVLLVATTSSWFGALMPLSFAVALVVVGAMWALPRTAARPQVAAGAITATLLSAAPVLIFVLVQVSAAIRTVVISVMDLRPIGLRAPMIDVWAFPLGLLALAAGFAVFSFVARRRPALHSQRTLAETLAIAFGVLALVTFASGTPVPLAVRVGVLLVVAAGVSLWLFRMPQLTAARRIAALFAAHILLAFGAFLSWSEVALAPALGVGALLALVAVSFAMPPASRFLHVGAGYAYALVLIFVALGQWGVQGTAVPAITTSLGLLGAIVTTFTPRVRAREWYAVLAVSAVPFVIGVVQVIFERSGWTALSTGFMFALALALLLTRRAGLNLRLRTAAAALLVPTLAVTIISLGAQFLAMSASPVTLPIIAAIVALVLPSTPLIAELLQRNGLSAEASRAARIAIELSALLTGAIAVLLALVREASGLGTTFIVLLVLGVGSTASALITRRRYAWWVAGAAFTGALWCVWAMAGLDVLEPYLLPPTVGAALVAVILTARGERGRALFATALAVAIVPVLALVIVAPDATPTALSLWRALALIATSWALLAACALSRAVAARGQDGVSALLDAPAARIRQVRLRRLAPLQLPTLLAAAGAAVAGPVLAIRIGLGYELPLLSSATSVFLLSFAASATGATALLVAARGIRSVAAATHPLARTRWLEAPAVLALPLGTWFAIERDWFVIWAMWALMLAVLIAMVAVARQRKSTQTPVWFFFAIAFVTAIVAWSPRDLRVEWFSLPLGIFLLAAGASALRSHSGQATQGTLSSWPARWRGSWALLAPGLVVTVLASIVATFTDPLTWRAILVIAIALLMILIGAAKRLAAPFVIGMLVLPIENVFAFSVQIGRGIESMPWWITLAVVGAVLLILAVTYERRAGEAGSMVARLRDLA